MITTPSIPDEEPDDHYMHSSSCTRMKSLPLLHKILVAVCRHLGSGKSEVGSKLMQDQTAIAPSNLSWKKELEGFIGDARPPQSNKDPSRSSTVEWCINFPVKQISTKYIQERNTKTITAATIHFSTVSIISTIYQSDYNHDVVTYRLCTMVSNATCLVLDNLPITFPLAHTYSHYAACIHKIWHRLCHAVCLLRLWGKALKLKNKASMKRSCSLVIVLQVIICVTKYVFCGIRLSCVDSAIQKINLSDKHWC